VQKALNLQPKKGCNEAAYLDEKIKLKRELKILTQSSTKFEEKFEDKSLKKERPQPSIFLETKIKAY
jgi:hypothetical protein